METLYPASYMWNSNWSMQQRFQSKNTKWTKEENKLFESALALIDEKTPDRWLKLAAMTGRSVAEVTNQYMKLEADVCDIEAGFVEPPGYLASSFTLDLNENRGFDVFRKRGRSCDQERKKGVPWTEEEHRRFLQGLLKYGKGDWRNISRNFVISKNPTQVASHAQKYFLRQQLGGGGARGGGSKDKRRPSIHDITTVHVTNYNSNQADANQVASLASNTLHNSSPTNTIVVEWNDSFNDGIMDLGSINSDIVAAYSPDPAGFGCYGADAANTGLLI
ncbi:hypothetical protein LIER_41690 [Lithospermum erythrorhizon]|uniref:Uncharacterized protein n=1 Tax=Lithospermum erythrorhizon TaxID=34254 RepID=A0AAV3RCZ1_LITER